MANRHLRSYAVDFESVVRAFSMPRFGAGVQCRNFSDFESVLRAFSIPRFGARVLCPSSSGSRFFKDLFKVSGISSDIVTGT